MLLVQGLRFPTGAVRRISFRLNYSSTVPSGLPSALSSFISLPHSPLSSVECRTFPHGPSLRKYTCRSHFMIVVVAATGGSTRGRAQLRGEAGDWPSRELEFRGCRDVEKPRGGVHVHRGSGGGGLREGNFHASTRATRNIES